jgi:hypothetical protein
MPEGTHQQPKREEKDGKGRRIREKAIASVIAIETVREYAHKERSKGKQEGCDSGRQTTHNYAPAKIKEGWGKCIH